MTSDSAADDAFHINMSEGIVKFTCSPDGLYYLKVSDKFKSDIQDVTKATHVETLEENHLGYTQRDLDRAKQAQEFYYTIGTPTIQALKAMLRTNQIQNCSVTSDDLTLAERIYGQSVSSLKGKSTCQKPKVVTTDNIKIPIIILE